LGSATALNMIDMIGVGPFITIPLICGRDGWSAGDAGLDSGRTFRRMRRPRLGGTRCCLSRRGGSYRYLSEIYGPRKLGRLLSFLFVWQLSFSAPLSIASGCIGFFAICVLLLAQFRNGILARQATIPLGLLGSIQVRWLVNGATFLAIATCLLAVFLLYRKITDIGWMSKVLFSSSSEQSAGLSLRVSRILTRSSLSASLPAHSIFHRVLLGPRRRPPHRQLRLLGLLQRGFPGGEVRDPEKTFRARCCFPFSLWRVYTL